MPQQNINKKINYWKWLTPIIIISIVVLTIAIIATSIIRFGNFEKNKALTYLDTKYGQTFVIKSQHIYPTSIITAWDMDLIVAPSNDPSLEFKLSQNIVGPTKSAPVENYLGIVWQRQAASALKQYLGNVYGEDNMPEYSDVYASRDDFLAQYNEGKVLTLQQAINKYGNGIVSGTLNITVKINDPFSDINNQAEKFMQIIPYLQSENLPKKSLSYSITSSSNRTAYQCYLSTDQISNKNLDDIIKCFDEGKYVNYDA